MNIRISALTLSLLLAANAPVFADEAEDLEKARDALSKQDNDADTEKALEQVFEAAEKNYSLLRKGGKSLNFNSDYSYYGDQRIDLTIERDGESSVIRNADVSPVASHTFTNSFTFDYGLLDNLTVSARMPLIAKYETEDELSGYGLGDLSSTFRWQPFSYVPGRLSQTYFFTARFPTGESPYEIDESESLATGSGSYGTSGGVSVSKVLDPVVVFGSLSAGYSFPTTGLNQIRNDSILTEVRSGPSASFSMGFAYSLSYEVSLSMSFQGSYSHKSDFVLFTPSTGEETTSTTSSQMSGIMNFALGLRVSPKTITNINVGFGMTELSPDIILGISLPINIEGRNSSQGS